jgi:hypothetical protein
MRTLRLLVVAGLALGGLAVLAPGASASAPAASAKLVKFCKAVEHISSDAPSGSNSAKTKKLVNTTRNAAKLALTSKVKSALNTMADYFQAVGDAGTNPGKLAAATKLAGKYARAAAVYTGYYIANCSTISS